MGEPVAGSRIAAFPGIAAAREPLSWYDTLQAGFGGSAAWRGYDATLGMASPAPRASPPRTRATFHLLDGDFGLDETGLGFERGDSLARLRLGALDARHGARGAAGQGGRHVWGASGAVTFGLHRLEAGYAQRGAAASLAGGEEQSLRGESGRVAWRWSREGAHLALGVARAVDAGESFVTAEDADSWSRRDLWRNDIEFEAGAVRGDRELGARVLWSDSRVRRSHGPAFDRRTRSLWAAARLTRPLGEGTLDLGLGAGGHGEFEGWNAAPTLAYRFAGGPFGGRVLVERMLAPVWTDLAPGVAPFLQQTWVAGCDLSVASPAGRWAKLGVRFGMSHDRAIVSRSPLEEQWLRAGHRADPGRYEFGLVTAAAEWRVRALGASAEGFVLGADPGAGEPRVDPPYGARLALEAGFRPFGKDLDVTLRAEADGVGPRESEAAVPRRLDGYASLGIAGTFSLGDAVLTLRIRNLENRVRLETWIDSASGREALGVGRELRLAFSWRMFD